CWPWQSPPDGRGYPMDAGRVCAVPWLRSLLVAALHVAVLALLSSCTVLVESDAFRTLMAPTRDVVPATVDASSADEPVSTDRPRPSPSALSPTPLPVEEELPSEWLRDLAWAELVDEGIADGILEPLWDDACGPAMFCWGAWRLQVRRLVPEGEVDRFGVVVHGPKALVCELVVASDGVARVETLATATPWPTRTPMPTPTPASTVASYVISVHSLPTGSAFDDMARVWSDPAQQLGVRGVNATVEEALAAVRDTGCLVTVEAWQEKDVPDYGGGQLVVESVTQVWPLPERTTGDRVVEGWLGQLVQLPDGAAYDDYFDCRWPGGQYGIGAEDEALAEALRRLGESGELVRVWGLLQEDMEDYGKSRLYVSRIELAELVDDSE
ncbi:MAG: hypothetical protein ACP5G7_13075, partial [Anaerolineae bacterium]